MRRSIAARRDAALPVRVFGKHQNALIAAPFDVGRVDSGVREHIAEPVADDDQPRTRPHHRFGFGKDQLDHPRVLLRLGGKPLGLRRGRYRGEVDLPALSLGNDLLGDDQDVSRGGREAAGRVRVEDDPAKVIALRDIRHAFEGEDFEPWRARGQSAPSSGRPVMRIPEPGES